MSQVRVFSTSFCPYCVTLKGFLKERGVEFEDIDVTEDKTGLDEMIEKSGQTSVPVIEIDNQIVVGFERDKIIQLLKIKK